MAEPAKSPAPESPKFLWIQWNADNVYGATHRPVKQEGSNTLSAPPTLSIPPGASVIDRAFWEKWKTQDPEEYKRLTATNIPGDSHRNRRSERAGSKWLKEGPAVKDKNSPIADLSLDEARAIIPEIKDENLLRHLRKIENRPEFVAIIQAEIEKFDRAPRV